MPKKSYRLLMSALSLPQFNTVEDLSNLTGLSESLLYCLSQRQSHYYKEFIIPKRDGSKRTIYAPSYSMHIMQRWILKNILEKISPSQYAMAFRKGSAYGCKANAMHHIETRYGVSFDLQDFFPSIEAKRVQNVFTNIGYSSLAATILTNICTLNGVLPQGGACSPALSNLVCLSLDSRLSGLCEKRRIRFSRYADDMYFSSDSQDVLKKSVSIIRKIIESENFVINEKKIHYYTPSNHKRITGITITHEDSGNAQPKLKASNVIKRNIRAEIHKTIVVGDYSLQDRILGEIAYVNYIEPEYKQKIQEYIYTTAKKINIFPELVEQYNTHLFYKEMKKIHCCDISTIKDEGELQEYLNIREERKSYLERKGKSDICKYQNWPIIKIPTHTDTEDLPF